MSTISELNRTTEEKLDLAREKLKDLNERIFGSEKNREFTVNQRRRPIDMKRTLSSSSNSSIKDRLKFSDHEDEHPKIMSRVVSNKEASITKREQVIAMQSRQNDIGRNKRMFGSLLGTLQKFKKEENFLKSKEEKKALIEKKLEEQEQLEKIKLKEERDALIANRKKKQLEVKTLETKMDKLRDLQVWEENQKKSLNYIKTSIKPAIFWLPKVMNSKTTILQSKSNQDISEMIEERRKQVDEEIKEIESHIEKESESIDEHDTDKKNNSHNDDPSENGGHKVENNERGLKRRQSYSPEVKKRVCSQVIVKPKE
ncbi:pinin [Chironomus tepperi]|uniref:pinin n=1 Tax=Chironomus tepperi TaxID=113505 RepID=UPI00391F6653